MRVKIVRGSAVCVCVCVEIEKGSVWRSRVHVKVVGGSVCV